MKQAQRRLVLRRAGLSALAAAAPTGSVQAQAAAAPEAAAGVFALLSQAPGTAAALALAAAALGFAVAYAAFAHRPGAAPAAAAGDTGSGPNTNRLAGLGAAGIIDVSLLAIVALDADKNVMVWNPAAERMFGYSAEETIGKPYPLVPDSERAGFDSMFGSLEAGKIVRSMEVQRRRKDGTIITVVFSGVPLRDAGGTFRGGLFMLDDVTQHRLMQQQLMQSQKMDAVGQLTGGIAHDFNNLLAAIIGNLDMAVEEVRTAPQAIGMIEDALSAALRGADLVKRLLAFSRTQPLETRKVDLMPAVEEFLPLLRTSVGERVEVQVVPAGALWPVRADTVQLQNALLNLTINARDAMPEGGRVSIEAENIQLDSSFAQVYPGLAAGEYVRLSVTDTGTGMPPEVVNRAFEPFYTTKESGKGSGLGLSSVYGFMKQVGGITKIYSEPGVGTIVSLYFRRADVDETAAYVPPTPGEIPGGSESVLVVEDNPDVSKAAVGMLEALGYSAVQTINAEAALAALDRQRFDLLFTDIVMPGKMNGIGLAHEVRRRYPGMAVLMTSGFSSKLNADTDLKGLGADLLGKPYRKVDLAEAVRHALDKARRRALANSDAAPG